MTIKIVSKRQIVSICFRFQNITDDIYDLKAESLIKTADNKYIV